MKMKLAFALLLLLCLMPVLAQTGSGEETPEPQTEDEGCPTLVQTALDLTKTSCEQIGRDKVCYGHSTLEAESRPGAELEFEKPGDIEDVIEMNSLNLSPMDTIENVWGVILMKVRANLEASQQKNVTFVVFGDVALTNDSQVMPVTVTDSANIRSQPSTAGGVLASTAAGEMLTATGRTGDGEWVRVLLPEDESKSGWVSAELVETEGDLTTLPSAEDETPFGPMQAFYFESGRDDAPCSEAPNSGLMIQTPEGAASVTLWIDEVVIELDGAAFVQAQPNGDLTVNTLDGSATVTALGQSRTAVAGTQVSVPLDENLGAADVPEDPVAFDPEDVQSLPTTLLENPVDIPDPLELGEGVPAPGNWTFSWGVSEMTCPDGTVFTFESEGGLIGLSVGDGNISYSGKTYSRETTGVYTASFIDGEGNLYQERLTVNGLDSISGEAQIEVAAVICTLNVPFSLRLVG